MHVRQTSWYRHFQQTAEKMHLPVTGTPQIQRFIDQLEKKRKETRRSQSPPPDKVALGVHTHRRKPNIKTCTTPKISTLTIKTLAS